MFFGSVVGLLVLVNSAILLADPVDGRGGKNNKKLLELQDLVEKLVRGGRDHTIDRHLTEALGYADEVKTRAAEVRSDEASDGQTHDAHVVVDPAQGSGSGLRPVGVVFYTGKKEPGHRESFLFRLSTKGNLESAVLHEAKIDQKGHGVPGSAKDTGLDVKSPEVRSRLQHELDFWLKGMYRKPAESVGSQASEKATK